MHRLACIIFYAFFCAHTCAATGLLCRDWLNGRIIQYDELSAISQDSAGIKGQCRDKFPTWGERMKIERTSTDPFEAEYQITREYCWARFVLDSDQRCGGPRVTTWCLFIPCGFSWSPPAYTSWGDTKSTTVRSFQSGDTFQVYGSWNQAVMHRIGPGGKFPDGAVNQTQQTKICAYFKSNFIGNLFTSRDLIGCVNEPFKPIPKTFNQVLPSIVEPYVEAFNSKDPINLARPEDRAFLLNFLMAAGSRFDQPIVQLGFIAPNTSKKEELVLRFRFPNDLELYDSPAIPNHDAPSCGKFPSYPLTYCAKVPDDKPDLVCACEESVCDQNVFIGCHPRPTPKQSNIAIVAEYKAEPPISDGNAIPTLKVLFVKTNAQGKPLMQDKDGDTVMLNKSDNKYYKYDKNGYNANVIATEPLIYQYPLTLSKEPDSVTEYYKEQVQDPQTKQNSYVVSRRPASVYGLMFHAVIPELDEAGKPKQVRVETAQMKQSIDGCVATTKAFGEHGNVYYVPDGKRWRDSCCAMILKDPKNPTQEETLAQLSSCMVPQYQEKCWGVENPPKSGNIQGKGVNAPKQDLEAERAVCPGAYEGHLSSCTTYEECQKNPPKQPSICLINDSPWLEAMPEPYCVPILKSCDEVTTPVSESGYALWQKTTSDEMQTGTCDISYGLDYATEIKIEADYSAATTHEEKVLLQTTLQNAKSELVALQEKAKKEMRNVQISEFSITSGTAISQTQTKLTKNGVTFTRVQKKPQRQCSGKILVSEVSNPCVKADMCVAITKPAPINGNMILPSSEKAYMGAANANAMYNKGSVADPLEDISVAHGSCNGEYTTPEGSTKLLPRSCLTSYYTNGGSAYITRQVWGNDIQKMCLPKQYNHGKN